MKLGEVVVQLHQVSSKLDEKQKVFIIDHLTEVLSVKVPLRSCYVVGEFGLSKLTANWR